MLIYILFILGFLLLIKGADYLVEGSSGIARRFNVSPLVIGLTIVAFGTSAPELFVNLYASFQGNTDIAIGNVVGSNIANMLLILGVSAVIYPLTVTKGTVWKEIPFSLLAVILILVMANDQFIDNISVNALTRSDGFALIGFFIIFLYYTFGIAKVEGQNSETTADQPKPLYLQILMVLGGIAGLVLGGQWIVSGATAIAQVFNLSEAMIGLTIVAVGTSLPELATSAVAAYKKQSDIAIGNVVGSNIFNIFWILGVSTLIKPLPFRSELNFDLLVAIAAAILLFAWMFIGKRHTLTRWQGVTFILIYVSYITTVAIRG